METIASHPSGFDYDPWYLLKCLPREHWDWRFALCRARNWYVSSRVYINSYRFLTMFLTALYLAVQSNSCLLDRVYIYHNDRNGGAEQPEFRLRESLKSVIKENTQLATVVPGTIFLPIGLIMAGWGAEKKAPWTVVDIVERSSRFSPHDMLIMIASQGFVFIGARMFHAFQGA